MYLKRSKKSFVILSLYVDDVLIAGNDISLINAARDWLSSNFDMNRSKKFLGLSQDAHI